MFTDNESLMSVGDVPLDLLLVDEVGQNTRSFFSVHIILLTLANINDGFNLDLMTIKDFGSKEEVTSMI